MAQQTIAQIDTGLLVLVGVEPQDNDSTIDRMIERILGYRIFEDDQGRMNHSLKQLDGALLLVPQFTLAADTRKGMRPGFSTAAPPERGRELFERLTAVAQREHTRVEQGIFGAEMAVALINQGPATFLLRC